MRTAVSPVCVAALITAAASASAQVTDFRVTTTGGSLSDGTPVVANALAIDFLGQYTGSQVLVELTQGSIINVPFFGGNVDTAPTSGQIGAVPDLAFDTYLAQGGLFSNDPGAAGSPNLRGGAVMIDPTEASAVFNGPVKISQGWNPAGGTNIADRTDFIIANLAFTADAMGSFTYFASAGGQFFLKTTENAQAGAPPLFGIENGRIGNTLPGDYDDTRQVAQGDLDLVLANWGRDIGTAGVPAGWLQSLPSGHVSQNELDPVLINWGATLPSMLGTFDNAVPEPAAGLGVLAAAALVRRRRA